MSLSPDRAIENHSITRRLTAILIITVLIVSVIAVTAMHRVVSRAAMGGLEQKADETLAYLVGTLEMPLWAFDEDVIKTIGKAVSHDESIVRLSIRNASGTVIYSMEKDKDADLINRSGKIFHKQWNLEHLAGDVSVSMSPAIYKVGNRQLLLFSILIIFLILISVLTVTAICIRTSLNKPLKSLNEITNRFATGTYETSGHILPYLEFQPFGKALADMAKEIERQIRMVREAEAKYRLIFENAIEGIFQSTFEGRFLNTNPALAEILGYDSADDLSASVSERPNCLYVNPEERDKLFSLLREQEAVTGYEVEFRRKDEQVIWASISARMVRDEAGSPLFVEGFLTDISGRQKAEEERKALQERLQRAEKMEAIGTLAGGVAHDLNNVLGIVVGYSELLLGDMNESGPARSNAMEILKAGQRAAAIVQDLLTLARRGVSGRKVLNLNSIVSECLKSHEFSKVLSCHPRIGIQTDLEADLLNVSGSSVHLEKSLINLVSNAVEAMPSGGALVVKTANCYLDKLISGYDEVRQGDYVVVSVSDTGEGIPASDLKRIFEPFYTRKVMGRSGTGLGLAVVWGTVKDHLGYINVESEQGKGTTFILYFPVVRDEISPEQVSISLAEYMGNGQSILVVDDVKEQRQLAGTMLKKLNYTVVTVASGEEAVEHLKQNAVDLVVLDMIMEPGMDGLDAYAEILKIHPRQKAIIVSGFSETERVTKTQELGAGACVKKPYVLEKLGLAIRKEFDRQA
ncbi:MAG: ATP-binding protein [Syntrophobacteraceae bacterium]